MTPIRIDVLKRLLYIGLGVLPAVLFAGDKVPWRYIGTIGLIITLYQVVRILIISQLLFDDLFPPKKATNDRDAAPNKVIYNIAMIVFICGLIGIFLEITPFENTIKGGRFFEWSALTGLFIGVGMIFILRFKFPTLLNESDRRFSVVCGFVLGFLLLIPAIANFINTEIAAAKIDCMALPVTSRFTEGTNNSSYHVRLKIGREVEKFEIARELYDALSVGDTLKVCVKHGFFGYDFVDGSPTLLHR